MGFYIIEDTKSKTFYKERLRFTKDRYDANAFKSYIRAEITLNRLMNQCPERELRIVGL